ncbi:MAG: nitrous oxide reductase family maturation protein NosD [Candidatus Hermodarchaeota archaeon]
MKAVKKKKVFSLVIIGLITLSLCTLYNIPLLPARDNKSLLNFDEKPPRTSKKSGIIHINNNWTEAKIAGICNGSGSWSDPYVINDLIIDGRNSSNCIKIQNSSVYFRIENCTLLNAGSDWSSEYAGIKLIHTSNGMIVGNNCSRNMYGISLTSYCSNNTVYNNYVNYNFYSGISLNTFCSNNTISRNSANNNTTFGISISWNSHNNTVSKNNATKNIIGLEVSSFSKFNNIIENNLSYNDFPGWTSNGIRISRAENNSLVRNIVSHNGWEGIHAYESKQTHLLNNTIRNNGNLGIRLIHCDDNILQRNNISSNGQYGIYFEESKSNLIQYNTINNHSVGVYLDDLSSCNLISNNFLYGNGVDIQDFQKPCKDNGYTVPPLDLIIISLTIVGLILLITGTVFVLRNLPKVKIKKSKIK